MNAFPEPARIFRFSYEEGRVLDSAGKGLVEPLSFMSADFSSQRPTQVDAAAPSKQELDTAASIQEQIAYLELQRAHEEALSALEAARREARCDALRDMQIQMEQGLARERASIASLCAEFEAEKKAYFASVEKEVVKLSLAIAAQLVRKEVKIDPLLLRGAVRVALDKISGESGITLRVPENQEERWRSAMQEIERPDVQVVADSTMEEGDCVVSCQVGSADLGLAAQLEEIQKGFFDLLESRKV